jgi:hypothetical protein
MLITFFFLTIQYNFPLSFDSVQCESLKRRFWVSKNRSSIRFIFFAWNKLIFVPSENVLARLSFFKFWFVNFCVAESYRKFFLEQKKFHSTIGAKIPLPCAQKPAKITFLQLHILMPYITDVNFNIIPSSMPEFLKWYFPFTFFTKMFMHFS